MMGKLIAFTGITEQCKARLLAVQPEDCFT